MSWPILLVVITVSFGLGAFWHSKHAAAREINQLEQFLKKSVTLRDDLRSHTEMIRTELHPAGKSTTAYQFSQRDLKDMGASE